MYIEHFSTEEKVDTVYNLDIGKFTIYDNFMVSEIVEGVNLDYKACDILLSIVLSHFGNKPTFGYISNRVHTYSLVPTDLPRLKDLIPNKPRLAIVHHNELGQLSAQFERNFWPFELEVFNNLGQALDYITSSKLAC
ncbi:hypothetical protein EAX61_13015 [Dokdonia sinensis]|uniref:STAS/SEC14 domain-containing protein n=1 Tax=Dokdonia sinensis TaxID=2479847 RepID=A0A3M0FWZ2_9FLAO|nr:hypothetical protein [Dokdonia sinensis]RMB56978.1 hypothetical protein EAX61_13015 [Dokdonia sinensis]